MSKKAYDELKNPIKLEPLGTDRKKVRIWSLDGEFALFGLWLTSDSPRLYRSGNPFKRPCPLVPYTFTRDELQAEQERFAAYGAEKAPKLIGSGPKGKPTKTELRDHNKLVKGIQDEAKLAEKLAEIVPNVEKEEARVQRVRKKILQEQQNRLLFEARERPTRSRRTTQKVDYTYDGFESDDYVSSGSWTGRELTNRTSRGVVVDEDGVPLSLSQRVDAPLFPASGGRRASAPDRRWGMKSTRSSRLAARLHRQAHQKSRSRRLAKCSPRA